MENELAVEITGLRKSYGSTVALDGISLAIRRGESFGIIGPNGAGKTTLMGCLLGLIDPDEGKVSIFGDSPHLLATKKRIGYVPERLNFSRWMSGRSLVALHASLAGVTGRNRVTAVLRQVGLDEAAWGRPLQKYSRGMLQRVTLAQALVGSPDILFLDEPTSGIDPMGAIRFREVMAELNGRGATVILNSHQLDQMEQICHRVAFIKKGRVEAVEVVKDHDRLETLFLKLERSVAS